MTNTVSAVIQGTGDHAEQALAVGDAFWVTGQADDTTWIDPKTNAVATTVPRVPGHHHYIAYGFDSLWITTSENKVDRINPATSELIASIPYADGNADCQAFVYAIATSVWIADCDTYELIEIAPTTNSVVSRTPFATLIDEAKAQSVVATGGGTGSIWVITGDPLTSGSSSSAGLLRIDPNTHRGMAWVPLTPEQAGDAFPFVTDDAVWIGGIDQVTRVNVATNQVDATVATHPGDIIHVAVGFGSVWLENYDYNLVQRLDVAP